MIANPEDWIDRRLSLGVWVESWLTSQASRVFNLAAL